MARFYRHGRFVINRYQFVTGGEQDVVSFDFVKDSAQGFGVPAKSLVIYNHGGGSGTNLIYFRTTERSDSWDRTGIIDPDTAEGYEVADGVIFSQIMLWASNSNCRFSIRATPGVWTKQEALDYVSSFEASSAITVDEEISPI